MSQPPRPPERPRIGPGSLAHLLRALTAASVLLSAVAHLFLWADGMSAVDVVGPAFLVNAVGGIVLAVFVLAWYSPLPLLGSIAFGAGTLAAFVVSTTPGGFFGVHETWSGTPQLLSAAAEIGAIVFAVLALVVERRRST
ncbi:hypothetical protein [Pengzhenrongella frigida]|uniref:Uncharacterized protein n=1 Tax=Pengzhenrongella frigida TaxID=1259133 RepID=A0A4V1ZH80_9MICO|nr:hypothetical protein [Cellulomonas sp. HLT2-17]RYV51114.1 hypothetical protein EUA98_10055 [Cellulomonas sp. HLT2-17]